jgi:hydrogenase expression/formation protein HypD
MHEVELVQLLISEIKKCELPLAFMEVCGTHTMAISRYGLRGVLPANIKLLSGPGCPVCVTANRDIDTAIAFSQIPGLILTTFGDMIRVPGSRSSLARERAEGRDVRVVYSILEALEIARQNPSREVVFML